VFRLTIIRFAVVFALLPILQAATVRRGVVSASADENSCVAPKGVAAFPASQRQAFLWFTAEHVRAGDRLRVDWLDPGGNVSQSAEYTELPSAPSLCFVTQLPIAGFAPAAHPGVWTVRVEGDGQSLFSRQFRIDAGPSGGLSVTRASATSANAGQMEFTVEGTGFAGDSIIYIAQYTNAGGWHYLSALMPKSATASQLTGSGAELPPAEYLIIVRNGDGATSQPVRVILSTAGYKLPMAAGVPWVLTQGPYGAFSHWGNSLHAYDIAPTAGRCVVAMRGGIAYTHDRGLPQMKHSRSFGNYISIDHGNGEYSHYGHLATGTFVIANGQRVEQGQALATVGNSGYTLGEGGGYHIHVHVTRNISISAQSVPFEFEDLPGARARYRGTITSSNSSPLCDCTKHGEAAGSAPTARAKAQFAGAIQVEQWWNGFVRVAKNARSLQATLLWQDASADLDLHLVSPGGKHYGWYGDSTGYSGQRTNPQSFKLTKPEPGLWRVSVQAVRGGYAPISFTVDTSGVSAGGDTVAARGE
jgi:murein DD-endopeptidase MepM/ murein hydrolase activator NlpD